VNALLGAALCGLLAQDPDGREEIDGRPVAVATAALDGEGAPGDRPAVHRLLLEAMLAARRGDPDEHALFVRAADKADELGESGWLGVIDRYCALAPAERKDAATVWLDYIRAQPIGAASSPQLAARIEAIAERALLCDPLTRARAATALGMLFLGGPRHAECERWLREAIATYERLGLNGAEAIVARGNLGKLCVGERRWDEAAAILDPALAALPPVQQYDAVRAAMLKGLACALSQRGDHAACIDVLERAAQARLGAGQLIQWRRVRAERVRELLCAGRRREAQREAEELLADPQMESHPQLRLERTALLATFFEDVVSDATLEASAREARAARCFNLAVFFLTRCARRAQEAGEVARGLERVAEARALAESIGAGQMLAGIALEQAHLEIEGGSHEQAEQTLAPLCAPAAGAPMRAYALRALADVRAAQQRFAECARLRAESAALFGELDRADLQSRMLAAAARALHAAGARAAALDTAQRSLELLPLARRHAPSWAASVRLPLASHEVYDQLLGDLLALAADGEGERVFRAAELLKAGALLDEVLALREAGGARSPRLVDALDAAGGNADAPLAQALRTELLRLGAAPDATSGALPRVAALRDVQEALAADSGLLYFHTAAARSAVWLVTAGAVRSRLLPGREALAVAVGGYLARLRAQPGPGAFRPLHRAGRTLTRLLLGDLEADVLRCKRLAVVGDEILAELPFAALIAGPDADPQRAADVAYLGPDRGVRVANLPSATLLLHLLREERAASGAASLLVGHRGPGSGLASVAGELEAVRALLAPRPCRVAIDGEVLQALRAAGAQPLDVLHVAMHAGVDPDTRQPFLHVGEARFAPHDVVGAHLRARLVDLAACQSAAGPWLPGEGAADFARAFFATGSQHVLSAGWVLHDEAAARFSATFYAHLGQGAADACQRAQVALRRDPRFGEPFYWAAWRLAGAP
jgi:hypothetical protein